MHPFTLERPRDLQAALALRAQSGRNDIAAEYIAGGTDMVQLLQENVRRPDRLVSIGALTDRRIDVSPEGLRIGAGATMAEVAAHPGDGACNKRTPGSGCSAIRGENRWHAVLGGSDDCIAVHPSDLAVALVALDAVVHIQASGRERSVALAEFHRLPGSTPHIEAELRPGEVIAAITVPASPVA